MSLLPDSGAQDTVFDAAAEDARYFSRKESDEPLGTFSNHPFQLDDRVWPTVEHYIQAMQFRDEGRQELIRLADNPNTARKLGKTGFFRRPRPDWKSLKKVYMTRAVYTKCKAYPAVANALLETSDDMLVENDQYDYFWGCGRDRRGENAYGQILMQVRDKLREEAS